MWDKKFDRIERLDDNNMQVIVRLENDKESEDITIAFQIYADTDIDILFAELTAKVKDKLDFKDSIDDKLNKLKTKLGIE